VALLIVALVRRTGGGMRSAYVPPPPERHGPFVEAFALYMAGMVVVSLVASLFIAARRSRPTG
jgi:hypothetical protein